MNLISDISLYRPEIFIPKYKIIEKENWKISYMETGFDYGYYSDNWIVNNVPILLKYDKTKLVWETWMSIVPHEIESQELCFKYAYGCVVIMGLGLGWIAINTAMKKEVSKVYVIEIDKNVIDIFYESGALDDLPGEIREKIEIIHSDALKWKKNEEKINFLYADIWKNLLEEQTIDELKIMNQNLSPEVIYFWGQELFVHKAIKNLGIDENKIDTELMLYCIKNQIELPLLVPEDIDYINLINKVYQNRQRRGLKI